MAYSSGAVQALTSWVGDILPHNGSIIELGRQNVNQDTPIELISSCLSKIHTSAEAKENALSSFDFDNKNWWSADFFQESPIEYLALDLYDMPNTINCDLNVFAVPDTMKSKFDLLTNFGTSEHVLNQQNVFKVAHDALKVGGHQFHSVPFAGYHNHGLINYHPIFFAFLASANNYEIIKLNIGPPHLPYTVPGINFLDGAKHWENKTVQSGIVNCLLKKVDDAPFQNFTDVDINNVPKGPANELLKQFYHRRYDLKVTS